MSLPYLGPNVYLAVGTLESGSACSCSFIRPEQDQMQHLREENIALRHQTVQLQEQMEDLLQAADEKQELQVPAMQRGWSEGAQKWCVGPLEGGRTTQWPQ